MWLSGWTRYYLLLICLAIHSSFGTELRPCPPSTGPGPVASHSSWFRCWDVESGWPLDFQIPDTDGIVPAVPGNMSMWCHAWCQIGDPDLTNDDADDFEPERPRAAFKCYDGRWIDASWTPDGDDIIVPTTDDDGGHHEYYMTGVGIKCIDRDLQDRNGDNRKIWLNNGTYYRLLNEWTHFGAALQLADSDFYGGQRGHLVTPMMYDQDQLILDVLDKSSSKIRAWLPLRNRRNGLSRPRHLLSTLVPNTVFFHLESPEYSWVTGPESGTLVFNGTCDRCCTANFSNVINRCADVPPGGESTNGMYTGFDAGQEQPIPEYSCIALDKRWGWQSIDCDRLGAVIVQFDFLEATSNPKTEFVACNVLCECFDPIESYDALAAFHTFRNGSTSLPEFDNLMRNLVFDVRYECSRQHLVQLPDFVGMAPYTLENNLGIFLAHNNLTVGSLPVDSFAQVPFLVRLDLSYNAFVSVPLLRLEHLQYLDLSWNPITALPTGSFFGLPKLKELKLNGLNLLTAIHSGVLFSPGNGHLTKIEMHDNSLLTIDPNAFGIFVPVGTNFTAGDFIFDATPKPNQPGAGARCRMRALFRNAAVVLVPSCTCPTGYNSYESIYVQDFGNIGITSTYGCLRDSEVSDCMVKFESSIPMFSESEWSTNCFLGHFVYRDNNATSVVCAACKSSAEAISCSQARLSPLSVTDQVVACPGVFITTTQVSTSLLPLSNEVQSSDSSVIVGVSVGILFAAIAFGVIFFAWKRNRRQKVLSSLVSELSTAEHALSGRANELFYATFGDLMTDEEHVRLEQSFQDKLFTRNTVLNDVSEIARGPFGTVSRASIRTDSKANVSMAAVKYSNGDAIGKARLLVEARLLIFLKHPSIIPILGIQTWTSRPWIATPLMAHGDLRTYLRKVKSDIQEQASTEEQRLSLADADATAVVSKIADALHFLHRKGLVHGDIAARNVLVGKNAPREVYLSDLGATVPVTLGKISDKYSANDMMPFRWMPPETLLEYHQSYASDMWAFGVLVWEVLALGKTPYGALQFHEVRDMLIAGDRLPIPAMCFNELYEIARTCWATSPGDRPQFNHIHKQLSVILERIDGASIPSSMSDILPTSGAVVSKSSRSDATFVQNPIFAQRTDPQVSMEDLGTSVNTRDVSSI